MEEAVITRGLLEYLKGGGVTCIVKKNGESVFRASELSLEDTIAEMSHEPLAEDDIIPISDAILYFELLGLDEEKVLFRS